MVGEFDFSMSASTREYRLNELHSLAQQIITSSDDTTQLSMLLNLLHLCSVICSVKVVRRDVHS